MRLELSKICGERKEFIATVLKFGQKNGFKGYLVPTLLLVDLKDDSGKILTDHIWMNYFKQFKNAGLLSGDIISFRARVESYQKGYSEDSVDNPFRIDYHLTRPTKIKKIGKSPDETFRDFFSYNEQVLASIEAHNKQLAEERKKFYEFKERNISKSVKSSSNLLSNDKLVQENIFSYL